MVTGPFDELEIVGRENNHPKNFEQLPALLETRWRLRSTRSRRPGVISISIRIVSRSPWRKCSRIIDCDWCHYGPVTSWRLARKERRVEA